MATSDQSSIVMQSVFKFEVYASLATAYGRSRKGETLKLGGLEELRGVCEYIATLRIGPIPSRSAAEVAAIFQCTMPHLTGLVLHVDYSDVVEGTKEVPLKYMRSIDLPAGNLPRLSSLVLDGILVPFNNPVFTRLTYLALLNNRTHPHEPSYRLKHLLRMLSTCVDLKELEMRSFLRAASFEPEPYRTRIQRLEILDIKDHPLRISALMTYLELPAAVSINLATSFRLLKLDGTHVVPSLTSILPPGPEPLEHFPRRPVPFVSVEVLKEHIKLKATTRRGQEPFLTVTYLGDARDFSCPSMRTQSYSDVVSSLGTLLRPRPIVDLTLTGDFSFFDPINNSITYTRQTLPRFMYAPPLQTGPLQPQHVESFTGPRYKGHPANWQTAFLQLPDLRSLCIVDTANTPTPPEAFAHALADPRACPTLECLRLRNLQFETWGFVEALAQALCTRRSYGGKTLQSLSFEGYKAVGEGVGSTRAAKATLAQQIRDVLSPYVVECSVKVV